MVQKPRAKSLKKRTRFIKLRDYNKLFNVEYIHV